MGKKDTFQFDYLDDNERFADQVNGALFQGRQVVRPEELEPADERIVYLGKEAGKRNTFEAVADKARTWRGKQIHIITLQNQTYTDYRMVLRNMLSESIGYHKQWKLKKNAHERAGDLPPGTDAYSDTRELLEVMANVRIPEEYKVMEQGKECYDMCKAIEEMIEDGRMEGKVEGRLEGKAEGRIEGRIEAILELLEELGQVPQRIVEFIRSEDDMSVLSRWLKSAARAGSIAEFEADM